MGEQYPIQNLWDEEQIERIVADATDAPTKAEQGTTPTAQLEEEATVALGFSALEATGVKETEVVAHPANRARLKRLSGRRKRLVDFSDVVENDEEINQEQRRLTRDSLAQSRRRDAAQSPTGRNT